MLENRIKQALKWVWEYSPDLTMLCTALACAILTFYSAWAKHLPAWIEDQGTVVLAALGLISAGLWGWQRKARRELDLRKTEWQAQLGRIYENSDLVELLFEMEEGARGSAMTFARHRYDFAATARHLDGKAAALVKSGFRELEIQAEALTQARFSLPKHSSPTANARIMETFRERMDAVSDRDLKFWTSDLGKEYINKSLGMTGRGRRRGEKLTRIFIFSRRDLEEEMEMIEKVLRSQYRKRIGFAVALKGDTKELRKEVREYNTRHDETLQLRLDLALFDSDKAVTFFRRESHPDRFIAAFASRKEGCPNAKLIQEHRKIWVKLLCECWLVSDHFLEHLSGDALSSEERAILRNATKRDNDEIREKLKIEPDDEFFPVVVRDEAKIRETVEQVLQYYKNKRSVLQDEEREGRP